VFVCRIWMRRARSQRTHAHVHNSGRRGLVKPPGQIQASSIGRAIPLLKPQGACPVRERVLPPTIIFLTPPAGVAEPREQEEDNNETTTRQQRDNSEKTRQTGTYLFTPPAEPMNHRALKPYRKRLFRAGFRSRIRLSGTLWRHFFLSFFL
jgi:hypothetical protein